MEKKKIVIAALPEREHSHWFDLDLGELRDFIETLGSHTCFDYLTNDIRTRCARPYYTREELLESLVLDAMRRPEIFEIFSFDDGKERSVILDLSVSKKEA